jgi:uncharacterized coiled-coil DUF342 family protein
MAKAKPSPLVRQLGQVRRRLFLRTLLNCLAGCWTGATLLAVGWFLAQPLALEQPPDWLRWAVAGGLLAAATVLATVLAVLRAPSRLVSALSLDAEFGLKERVTTSLTLAPGQEASPAGQALLEDVNRRVKDLDVGSRFPVRMSWTAALVPLSAAVLALVAVFYEPPRSQANLNQRPEREQAPPNAADIERKMNELKKKVPEKPAQAKLKSEEIERLEAELEKIANKPRDNKEQIRERVKEMTALEEAMKKREQEMADKVRGLQQQLKQLDRMTQQKEGEGPAKDLQKALAEGKLDKAREEIERLNKRIQNNELNAKEKEQLKKQLENLKNNLERLAQQKDKEQQLRQANLDPETLQRELDRLKKDGEKLKGLQELAKQLGQCQKSLKEGDMEGLSQGLGKAGDKMKDMNLDEQDLQDLRDQLTRLQDAKDSC